VKSKMGFRPIDLEYHPNDPDRKLFDLNSYGYRTKEFIFNEDLLALGCSQTFGWGVEEKESWPEIISNKFNISVTNLSLPGDSVMGQVLKAFEYFKIYGNPKKIVGVFPINRILFAAGTVNPHHIKTWDLHRNKTPDRFSEIPHTPDKVFNVEVCQIQNYMFISMLEQYCRSNSIDFFYTFWDMHRTEGLELDFVENHDTDKVSDILGLKSVVMMPVWKKNADFCRYLKSNSKSYFDPVSLQIETKYPTVPIKTCHEDFMDHKNFYYASDTTHSFGGHFSFHEHLHYSDKISDILGLKSV
jgi:hypothetical protein